MASQGKARGTQNSAQLAVVDEAAAIEQHCPAPSHTKLKTCRLSDWRKICLTFASGSDSLSIINNILFNFAAGFSQFSSLVFGFFGLVHFRFSALLIVS